MISHTQREGFSPRFEIVSCFIEHDGKILLLQRQGHKPQPNTYGLPAGKVDTNESLENAIVRELNEETGLLTNDVTFFKTLFVKYNDYEFIYHIFSTQYTTLPSITINPEEHIQYLRKTPREALNMNLIPDEDHCIKLFYKIA